MRSRRVRGQATVELALALPVVLVALLAVVQVGLVVRDQLRVVHTTREAARAAAVDPRLATAAAAARSASDLDPSRLTVNMTGGAEQGTITVVVTYRSPTVVPIVGALLDDVELTEAATMRVE